MAVLQILCDLSVLFWCILQFSVAYLWRCFVPRARKSVAGNVVVLTGAGHGMGREVAIRLGQRGAKLALLDVMKKGVDEVADDINKNGGTARAYTCDVTNDVMVSEVAQRIEDELGDVDILINNAGIATCRDLLTRTMKSIQKTFDVNIVAYVRMVKTFLPKMIENNRGHIVNMASMSSFMASPFLVDYSSSKYAVRGFTESLREEIRQFYCKDIQITSIYPIFVSTGIFPTKLMRPGRAGVILSPAAAAGHIVDGILREEEEVYIPRGQRVLASLKGCLSYGIYKAMLDFSQTGVHPDTESTPSD